MSSTGIVTKRFRQHWNERTASGAARKALEVLIPGAARSTIPVNVEAAAKFLGIEQIVEDDLQNLDGLLSSTLSSTYLVTLRRGQTRVRKRFTLAHEIGHIVVYKSIGRRGGTAAAENLGCRAVTAEDREEERLCDVVASELLMPRDPFVEQMQHRGVCASSIPLIARKFDVSLQATSRRVASILGYEIGVSLWAMSESGSHLVPKWYLTKKGAATLPYAIELGHPAAALFTDRSFRGWHWFPLQGQMDKYFIDIQPLPNATRSWLLVVVFGDAAQQILAEISIGHTRSSVQQLPLMDE
jgi:hypothetical protein